MDPRDDGKPFARTDDRGKVVVLTFSGNWCGPAITRSGGTSADS
jgi:hypothetical protein